MPLPFPLLPVPSQTTFVQTTPAQTPPAKAPVHPGPGDLLPPFTLRFDRTEAKLPTESARGNAPDGGKPAEIVRFIGNVVFTIGDVRLQSDELTFDQSTFTLEATGNVVFTRGDEVLRGKRFILRGDEGTFQADDGQVVTPPFFIAGRVITQKPGEVRAQDARFAPDPEGKGELQFRASEIAIQSGGKTTLRNATVRVLGLRLLTLRKITLEPRKNGSQGGGILGGGGGGGAPALPLSIRASGISGTAVGLNVPVNLPFQISAILGAERTTKQGNNFSLRMHRTLVAPQNDTSSRSLLPTPGGIDKSVAGLSPLRQLLKARPTPLALDPVLDYESVLATGDRLTNPTRRGSRNVSLDFAYSTNREIGTRRQGPLLLSRKPEVVVSAEVPLARPFERDANNAEQRSYLRKRLRFVASFEGGAGSYDEVRLPSLLTPNRTTISRDRGYLQIGLGTLPYLLGSRVLVSASTTQWTSFYGSGTKYHYGESTVAGAYIFGIRRSVGASFIGRSQNGTSPFYFDQVDTQSEGQLRFQSPLPFAGGRYTFGILGRYDLTQKRFFDTEIALAVKGRVLEPRFSYKTLNAQFGFSVAVPGFSSPAYPPRPRPGGRPLPPAPIASLVR